MKDNIQAKKDIEAVYRYLKIYHPDKADINYAAALLDFMQTKINELAVNDPDELERLHEMFEKERRAD
jgi:hypothetical protein